MLTLTKQQIARQDFVDNEIFECIQKLLPRETRLEWDIELIAEVREAIRKEVVEKRKVISEEAFYPYEVISSFSLKYANVALKVASFKPLNTLAYAKENKNQTRQ